MQIGDCLVGFEASRRSIMPETLPEVWVQVRIFSSVSGPTLCMFLSLYSAVFLVGLNTRARKGPTGTVINHIAIIITPNVRLSKT